MRPDRSAWVRLTDPTPPHVARSWDAVVADLDAARASETADVFLGGGEPTRSPDLLHAVQRARAHGFRVAVMTDGQALTSPKRLDALHDAGVSRIDVRLHAPDAARHDRVGGAGSFTRATTALRLLARHPLTAAALVVLDDDTAQELPAFVTLAADLGVALHLVRRLGPPPDREAPPPASVVEALDRAWRAAATLDLQVDVDDVAWTPVPRTGDLPPPGLDRNLAELFDRGYLPPSAATGVRALGPAGEVAAVLDATERGGRLEQLGPSLAVSGAPPVDLPHCLGGLDRALDPTRRQQQEGCRPCPRADRCPGLALPLHDHVRLHPPRRWLTSPPRRVAVLHPWMIDKLLVTSTVPALAAALRARGVEAELLGRWDFAFDPHDLTAPRHHGDLARAMSFVYRTVTRRPDPLQNYRPAAGRLAHPFRAPEEPERSARIDAAYWSELDLSGFDTVIAPGWEAAERVWEHPTFGSDARLVVVDLHMLVGATPWMRRRLPPGDLPKHGTWWPGDRLEVHACFPRYQGLYRALGVPQHAMLWRPFPVWLGHVPPGPDPATCDAIFSGGKHLRDFATLEQAARRLRGKVHPIRIHAVPGALRRPEPPLEALGMAELPDFVHAIRTSRFVVLPLLHDVVHAAGISVAALALAAGRPVVATRTPAMLDHVRDGIDGLLVSPHDPGALADAIERLDTDPDLLARLAAGARQAAARLSVERWATEIVHGTAPVGSVPAPGMSGGTRYAW